ncbi:ABC transporter permease [Clostridium sediminicola]|uniref:ABC transporter permease n=1 Tax=Clostridium sediminicola TaxID=3114879 RepID=UPI0031F25508
MYFKIATNNIKKSYKDYGIYFITLTLAVCIFYNFNSMNSQTVMKDIGKIKALIKFISYISVFISIVFGGLIIYANNALLKKRKKEFGIYAALGMAKRKISRILIYETFMVGIISLIAGLLLGIVFSQGISVLTARLFEFRMNEYKFIISANAINKTFIYFGVMFILVMIFNTVVVSKHKLIDMINALKKNEEIKTRNPIVLAIIFILSIIVLGRAYYMGWKYVLTPKNINFPLSTIWGSVGTLLFFFGFSGFILLIIKKSKRIYLRRLNIFVIKQFNNKINTNFVSMTIICLMLFLTILILSTSLNFKNEFEKSLENSTPFDATIELSIYDEKQEIQDIEEALRSVDFELREFYQYAVLDTYSTNIKISSLLNQYANKPLKNRLRNYVGNLGVIKISEYNEVRKLRGESIVDLKENEVLLITSDDDEKQALKKLMKNESKLNINNKEYEIKSNIELKENGYNLFAIIHDSDVENMIKSLSIMYINNTSKESKEELENQVKVLKSKFKNIDYDRDKILNQYGFIIYADTKIQVYDEAKSSIGTILYIGIYLGFVFLIASAAVLAIQELTEASDSVNRYKALKKIGASKEMINKSILSQIIIHFMAPLALALIHSIAGFMILNRARASSFLEIGFTITITVVVVTIIYGGYLYATYIGYKNIIKNT